FPLCERLPSGSSAFPCCRSRVWQGPRQARRTPLKSPVRFPPRHYPDRSQGLLSARVAVADTPSDTCGGLYPLRGTAATLLRYRAVGSDYRIIEYKARIADLVILSIAKCGDS